MKAVISFYSKAFFYSLVALLITSAGSRSFGYSWEKTFGGSHFDAGNSVQQTDDGGYIVVGDTDSFGAGEDPYLIKTDADGNEQWSKAFEGRGSFSGQQTSDGGYIITGGWLYVLLLKTDGDGNEMWSKKLGGLRGSSVQQTNVGGYIITGEADGTTGGVLLLKTDGNGNEIWRKTFGIGSGGGGRSVQQTLDGGFIIAGSSFEGFPKRWQVILIKTDALGNETWSKTFGGDNRDRGNSVQQTDDDGYILAGSVGVHIKPPSFF